MVIKFRKWLIRLLAGKMGVVLNAEIVYDRNGRAGISYACRHGGMCDLSGVK